MPTVRPFVEHLEFAGYKSIRHARMGLSKLNVLMGSNGAGKSNLVSFFALLDASLDRKPDGYVGRNGEPNALVHLGVKHTSEITSALTVRTAAGRGTLCQRLGFRSPDSLFYSSNHASAAEGVDHADELVIDGFCAVTKLSGTGHPGQLIYASLKDRMATYHLVDTSLTSSIRT
jgi:hypothetical protein